MSAFELPSSSESSCSDADTEPEWVDGTSVPRGKGEKGKYNSKNLQNSQAVASLVEEEDWSKQGKGWKMSDNIGRDEEPRTLNGGGLGDSGGDACALEAIKQREKGVSQGRFNREFGSRRKQVKGGGIVPIKRGGPIILPVPPGIARSSSSKSNIGHVRSIWDVDYLKWS